METNRNKTPSYENIISNLRASIKIEGDNFLGIFRNHTLFGQEAINTMKETDKLTIGYLNRKIHNGSNITIFLEDGKYQPKLREQYQIRANTGIAKGITIDEMISYLSNGDALARYQAYELVLIKILKQFYNDKLNISYEDVPNFQALGINTEAIYDNPKMPIERKIRASNNVITNCVIRDLKLAARILQSTYKKDSHVIPIIYRGLVHAGSLMNALQALSKQDFIPLFGLPPKEISFYFVDYTVSWVKPIWDYQFWEELMSQTKITVENAVSNPTLLNTSGIVQKMLKRPPWNNMVRDSLQSYIDKKEVEQQVTFKTIKL